MKDPEVIVPILTEEYTVVATWGDVDTVNRCLAKHQPRSEERLMGWDGRGVCFYHGGGPPVIAMPKAPRTPQQIGTLVHEACHAVGWIMNYIGAKEHADYEVFSHCVAAVVRTTLAAVRTQGTRAAKP